jgi:protein-S-isoprenylcysteine O-methyltransferase Ste14
MFYPALIAGLWVAWGLYWVVAGSAAAPVRRMESRASQLAHFVPLALAVVLLAAPVPAGWRAARFLPRTLGAYWVGVALLVAGLGFACWARVHLGRNWSSAVTVKQGHELIRSGPYGWVRHPIYTGLLLAVVGSVVARGEWRGVLAVALTLYAFRRKIRLEEAWMEEQFPAAYPAYRAAVPALVPLLR